MIGCYCVAHQTLWWQILRGRSFIPSFFSLLRGKEEQINLENKEHHTYPQSQYSGVWGRRIKGLRPASATNSSEPSQPGIHSKTLLALEPHKPHHHWAAPSKPLSSWRGHNISTVFFCHDRWNSRYALGKCHQSWHPGSKRKSTTFGIKWAWVCILAVSFVTQHVTIMSPCVFMWVGANGTSQVVLEGYVIFESCHSWAQFKQMD